MQIPRASRLTPCAERSGTAFFTDFAQYGDLDPTIAEAIGAKVRRLDVVVAAEAADLPEELLHIVTLLPPGDYTRQRLCTQLNSAIAGHAWGQVYGTVE